jgi:hypothetical protein
MAEKEETQQWGEWLRASPRKSHKAPPPEQPIIFSNSYYSRLSGSKVRHKSGSYVRDLPPRKNLNNDYDYSSSSHTGGHEQRRDRAEVSSPEKRHRMQGGTTS